jgi:DNA-binding cell septation regulator SpoVG
MSTSTTTLDVQVFPLRTMNLDKPLRAMAKVTVGGLRLSGFRVLENHQGTFFLAPPQEKGRDGKFYDTVFIEDKATRDELNNLAVAKLEAALDI